MSNESSTPSPDPTKPAGAAAAPAAQPAPPLAPPPRKRSRIKRFLLGWLAGVLVALAIWTFAALSFTYSEGDRGGVLQKLSRKGWLCKTYEGELALYVVPGMAPEIWEFSVRDEAVAKQLSGFVGERIQLHYAEQRGIPTNCFGETPYFVDRVTPAPSPTPPVLPDASAPPATPSPP
ncbi:MAG: hypothetical protein ACKO9D_01400 [Gammaproteobacteria bacterium]